MEWWLTLRRRVDDEDKGAVTLVLDWDDLPDINEMRKFLELMVEEHEEAS